MKQKTKPVDLTQCKINLLQLTNYLGIIDRTSQDFLNLDSLTPSRRLSLNEAARLLKREIIFAQTDIWKELTKKDLQAIPPLQENNEYQIVAEWVPKLKALKKGKVK